MIEVIAPGPLTTVQDLGRAGFAALGVPRSGAFDRAALRRGNRLVGNTESAAALEVTLGGLAVRFDAAATIALTGARCPGAPDQDAAVTVAAGTVLRLGVPVSGLRSYLAVRGGIAVDAVLGSCAAHRRRAARRLVHRVGDDAADHGGLAGARRERPHRDPARRPAPAAAQRRRVAERAGAAGSAAGATGRPADPVRPRRAGDRRLPGDRGGARSRPGRAAASR
jgi:hypothetical protein